MNIRKTFCVSMGAVWLAVCANAAQFQVSYQVKDVPSFTGRILVCVSKTQSEPMLLSGFPRLDPVYAVDVEKLAPGATVTISDENAISFPAAPSHLDPGSYRIQVLFDQNPTAPNAGKQAGNYFSTAKSFEISGDPKQSISLQADQVVAPASYATTTHSKELKIESPLLTAFYGKPISLKASVWLPEEFLKDPNRKFPVIYEIHGYGWEYRFAGGKASARPPIAGEPFIYVDLDGSCSMGHSVYADSDNNGPWAQAFIKEIIPAVEQQFRGIPARHARFVNGHSSGGWSSMYLMLNFPEVFGACWASSPDPLDFSDFCGINLYDPNEQLFVTASGEPRLNATLAGVIGLRTMQEQSDYEQVVRGEQLRSFEAVFSGKRPTGEPDQLWNRITGRINSKVVEQWKRYDLSLKLKKDWAKLEPLVKDRITLSMGVQDNFGLTESAKRFALLLRDLKANADLLFVMGDHFTIDKAPIRARWESRVAKIFKDGAAKP